MQMQSSINYLSEYHSIFGDILIRCQYDDIIVVLINEPI